MSIMSAMREHTTGGFIPPGERCEVTITEFEQVVCRSGRPGIRLIAEDDSGRTVTNYFTPGWALMSFLRLFFTSAELDRCTDEDLEKIVGQRFVATTRESDDRRYVNIHAWAPARPVEATSGDEEAEQAF